MRDLDFDDIWNHIAQDSIRRRPLDQQTFEAFEALGRFPGKPAGAKIGFLIFAIIQTWQELT